MTSTWKVEVIPLNYTRLFIKNKALSALTRHKLPPLPPNGSAYNLYRALPDSNWDTPN